MPDVTRIIEQTATESIFNDDWLIKDSPTNGTTKIQPSVLKAWINDGMATDEELETAVDDTIAKLSAVGSASGAIATFDDGSDLPMPSLKVAIEPVQSGSGDPSPTNIRPISGWDEVNVTVVGKNIFGGLPLANAIVDAGGTLDTANKTVSFTHGNSQVNILENIKLKESTSYTFILTYSNAGNNNCLSLFYKTSGTRYPINLNNSSDTKITIVYTTSAVTIDKLVLGWVLDANTNIYYEESGLFEGELTASDFEAYNGHTYTIDLDGTRYGGTLDVISGVLTVDREFNTFTELPSQYADVGNDIVCAFIQSNNMKANSRNDGLSNYFSPTTTIIGQNNPWRVCFGINNKRIYFTFDPEVIGGNTLQNINNYVAINPIQVVYPLATPITYQLTPTQVKSLLGVNNIWTDTGDVLDAEYIRDMTTIIDSLIARIEALENQ